MCTSVAIGMLITYFLSELASASVAFGEIFLFKSDCPSAPHSSVN